MKSYLNRTGRRFTLIELIVVIVLMGMLMTLAIPTFSKLAVGSGVDSSLRIFCSQLNRARQVAITERQYVAIIAPDDADLKETSPTPAGRYNSYSCYRLATVTRDEYGGFVFDNWLESSSWNFLPNGTYIKLEKGATDVKVSNLKDLSGNDKKPLKLLSKSPSNYVKAIILRKNGTPVLAPFQVGEHAIKISQGYWSGSKLASQNENNYFDVKLNPHTGNHEIWQAGVDPDKVTP